MADSSIVAFGRYLKIVRERRKLSLEDVAHLTKAYPEPVNKGYLSRVERGLNHVGFSKMVALSRAYEVPLDALGERYGLDLEVDRLRDAPDTAQHSFGELIERARRYIRSGKRLHAFATARDALSKARTDPVIPNYSDTSEQIAAACLVHGVTAVALARYRLGLVEVGTAAAMNALRAEFLPIVSHELSVIYRQLGEPTRAKAHADSAIAEALRSPKNKYLGDAYSVRAKLAKDERQFDEAISLYQSAVRAMKAAGRLEECPRVFLNLANTYFSAGRVGASRRAIASAQKLETETGTSAVTAHLEALLGEIAASSGQVSLASNHWHKAIEAAKDRNDRITQFKAEFYLFRQAVAAGNATVLNALGRRLSRLAPWVPTAEVEVGEFIELYARHRKPKQRGVAAQQPARSRLDNDHGRKPL